MKNNIQVNFYSITSNALERPLIKLLEKIYESGSKILLKVKSSEEAELLDSLLWTYSPITFLAHGNDNSPYPEKQPIFITSKDENPNKADIVLIFNEAEESSTEYSKVIYFFDGQNDHLGKLNYLRLEKHKKLNHQIKYWQQNESGSWIQVE